MPVKDFVLVGAILSELPGTVRNGDYGFVAVGEGLIPIARNVGQRQRIPFVRFDGEGTAVECMIFASRERDGDRL